MTADTICFVGQVVVCALPLNALGSFWLVALGWAVLGMAVLLDWHARIAFQPMGGAPQGARWLETRRAVTRGVHAWVRLPTDLSFAMVSLALALHAQHWLGVALGAILIGLLVNDMGREEQANLDRFADAYHDHMHLVPRLNIVAGLLRAGRAEKNVEQHS